MKKQHMVLGGLALTGLMILLLMERQHRSANLSRTNGTNQGSESYPDQPPKQAVSENDSQNNKDGTKNTSNNSGIASTSNGNSNSGTATGLQEPAKKENNCFSYSYQHQSKNQNRDIEDFLNDTNAFPIGSANVNQKSICVKVNNKPVSHKLVKKDGKTEVLIGSVVGPESTIQVSYCVGNAPCKEACAVKTKNKVDELLSDSEMGGLENAELETQVKELRNVASVHGDLMDSTVIRDWNKLQSKEWVCAK